MNSMEAAVRVLVDLLVRGEYATIDRISGGARISASDLKRAVADYGRVLAAPGDGWWDDVSVTPIETDGSPSFHIAVPLWTQEEGRSDLTLEVRLDEVAPEAFETQIEDLHVL